MFSLMTLSAVAQELVATRAWAEGFNIKHILEAKERAGIVLPEELQEEEPDTEELVQEARQRSGARYSPSIRRKQGGCGPEKKGGGREGGRDG